MTAFEDLERGDIIWASDPLSEKGRPMLVLGAPQLPNHGTQLITALLSTKAYHEESLSLETTTTRATHSENEATCFRGRLQHSTVLQTSITISPLSSTTVQTMWRTK